jgi:hypothetical protein
MTVSATVIVQKFLDTHGVRELECEPDRRVAPTLNGECFSHEWLRRWVWQEFKEVPSSSAIVNAYAMLCALARGNE